MSKIINPKDQKALLRNMMRVRRMEELCAELYTQQKIRGFLHLYIGQEAVATGVLSQVRTQDNVIATYREHGHALLKGLTARSIMAEMFGKLSGCSRGRGGSMHLFSRELRFFGGNAIVGGGLPHAVGLAFAAKRLKEDRQTFCFFGEGAMAEGAFHESLNLAALWESPVIFCCENNLYAMGTALHRSESQTDLVAKARSYGVESWSVDGMRVSAVVDSVLRALGYVRAEQRPVFLEFNTYRFQAHSMFDPELYRQKAEVERWRERCPISNFQKDLKENGLLSDAELKQWANEIDNEMMDAIRFAEESPVEPTSELERFLYLEPSSEISGGSP